MEQESTERRWARIIADVMEENLDFYRSGQFMAISFASALASEDAALYDSRNVKDDELYAVWNFADSFADAAYHGFPEIDGVPMVVAVRILRDVIKRLRAGEPIVDPVVVSYGRKRWRRMRDLG